MIYSPKSYNFVSSRLSAISLAQIWTAIGVVLFTFFVAVLITLSGTDIEGAGMGLGMIGLVSFLYSIAAIVLFIIFFVRLYDYHGEMQGRDRRASGLLITAIWLYIGAVLATIIASSVTAVSAVFGLLTEPDDIEDLLDSITYGAPLVVVIYIIAAVLELTAFILTLTGYHMLSKSDTILPEAAAGWGKLFLAVIILLIALVAAVLILVIAASAGIEEVAFIALALIVIVSIVSLVLTIMGWKAIGAQAPMPLGE